MYVDNTRNERGKTDENDSNMREDYATYWERRARLKEALNRPTDGCDLIALSMAFHNRGPWKRRVFIE